MNAEYSYHEPVLLLETLELLNLSPGKTVLDATLGGGGHSSRIISHIAPGGTLIALDRDLDALEEAGQKLQSQANDVQVILAHTSFGEMESALSAQSAARDIRLDGVLFDLGVSSHQLDTERGFSFRRDEKIDMRMDASSGQTAANLLAEEPEEEIARILWEYGEERFSRRIAHNIVAMRKSGEAITSTFELVKVIERSVPRSAWPKDIHVATKAMMALRIAVNCELDQLRAGLEAAVNRLKPSGRVLVISFHSLEDRIVKQAFNAMSGRSPLPQASSMASVQAAMNQPEPMLKLITRKPVLPTQTEIARNPRSRSARLRAAEKI